MRKLLPGILCLFLAATVLPSKAQIKKGETMLGGTVGILHEKVKFDYNESEQKGFQVAITPQVGIGLSKNWIVGVGAGYAFAKYTETGSMNDQELSTFSAGLFARKFHEFQDKFGIFGQLNTEIGFGKGERAGYIETKVTVLAANVQPGFYFRPSKKIILEAIFGKIGYTHTKTDFNEGTFSDMKDGKLEFSLTEGLALGFKVVL